VIGLLNAIRDHLASLQYQTHLIRAVDPVPPYLVLGGPAWGTPDEPPLSGPVTSLDADFRVTGTTGTPEGVLIVLGRVRDLLSPGLDWTPVPTADGALHVRFTRSEFVDVDTSTTVTGTNRHPAFGVDTYRLAFEPAT
jgi:hypothetical protein